MAAKKTFTTYKGVAVYPHLNKPDFAFNSDGVYTTKIRVPADQAKEMMADIKEAAQEEFGKAANTARMPWKVDETTGELIFSSKSKFKPKFTDSTGKIMPENQVPDIFGGSVLRLAGTIYPYKGNGTGVSLQLGAVQIITLADPVGNFAFEAEEGGFVADGAVNDNASNDSEEDHGDTPREAHDF